MRLKSIYIILVLICMSVTAHAGTIQGKVLDEQGLALPFATVFVQGTTQGTSANAQGFYQLSLPDGKYTIGTRYMGYQQISFTVTLQNSQTVNHDFKLQEQTLNMKEVVVHANAEDPAYRIIRQAIKKRKQHQKQISSFQTGIYLKGVLRSRVAPKKFFGEDVQMDGVDSNGKGVLYLCEEIADYYSNGKKEHTVIHSVKESGDPNGFGFSQMPPVTSFYDNNIIIGQKITPRGFVSPIADGALNYYKYKLLGEFKENDITIYKIQLTPKRKYEPLCSGTIYIVDEDWAIHSLDVTVNKKSGLEMLDTLHFEQVYLPLAKDLWVIKSQVLYPTISVLGFGITGSFVTVYNNQKVNASIPDSIFNTKIVGQYDRDANKKDTSYWETTRPVLLEQDEVKDYVVKDSIRQRYESPEYQDSQRRKANKLHTSELVYSGITLTGKQSKQIFSSKSLLGTLSYNTVEGLCIAPKLMLVSKLDSSARLITRIAPRYGFSNTHFNSIASLTYNHNDKYFPQKQWAVTAEGGKYVFQYNPQNPITPFLNTLSTLFFAGNYMKLYERWTGSLMYSRNEGNGFSWNAKLSFQKRLPLENTTSYTFTTEDRKKNLTDNNFFYNPLPPLVEHNAVIATVNVNWQPGITYTLYPTFKYAHPSNLPVFNLSYQKGIKGIFNSVSNFDKWRFSVKDELNLKLKGTLDYNVAAGGFLNKKYASLPDLNHLEGNQIIYEDDFLQRFQLASYYLFSNTKSLYGEAHIEYYLKGLLTNKIPLLRQAKWYFILGTNSYYAGNDLYYAEAFIGADNLGISVARVLRVDVVTSWDSYYKKQSWGLRIGLRPNALIRFEKSSSSEW